ncbi:hypothetical protein Tco_0783060 [Tanacetum coccineum]
MKAVKEKEQLQKTVDSWKNSSKNLWKLVDSGINSTSKVGLGYDIQSNNKVLSYEEEMNRTVFKCTEEDFLNKPLYNRFSKNDNFKGVPHPLTGDYTPKLQEEIDDSLYVYGKKGPQKPEISVSDDSSNEHSTCQSNNSEGSFGNPSEHSSESESESLSVPKEMSTSTSATTNEKTPKVNRKNWNEMMERELGEGYSFIKKKDFVCGSLSHLIKDCEFYEKKMARQAELKKQRVFNTGNRAAKPVWNNANRVNHANHLSNVNTGSFKINTGRSKQPVPTSNSNSFSPVRPQGNKFNQRSNFSKLHSPVRRPIVRNTSKMSYTHAVNRNRGTAVKTSAGYNWRRTRPNSNYNSGSNFVRTDHPLKNMEDRGIFDSRCSGHMTGNKDHLDDFKEFKGRSVTFGGSKGYITGKGRIRVGTLQTPTTNASEEEDEADELIVVLTVVQHTAAKVGPRKSSINSKAEECLTELQNLKTQEKEAYSTGISDNTPETLAFRRELDELFQKHLREVSKSKATSTTSVNSGSGPVNTQHADQDDSNMPELTFFNKPQKGIFDEASYDDEGMVYDFNNIPTEVAVSPIPTLRIHNIHPQSQILGDPKSSVQTRSRVQQNSGSHALVSYVQKQQRNNHKDQ